MCCRGSLPLFCGVSILTLTHHDKIYVHNKWRGATHCPLDRITRLWGSNLESYQHNCPRFEATVSCLILLYQCNFVFQFCIVLVFCFKWIYDWMPSGRGLLSRQRQIEKKPSVGEHRLEICETSTVHLISQSVTSDSPLLPLRLNRDNRGDSI